MRKIVWTIPWVLMVSAALWVLLTYAGDFIDEEPFQTESGIVEEVEVEHEAGIEISSQFSGEEKIWEEISSWVDIWDNPWSIDSIWNSDNYWVINNAWNNDSPWIIDNTWINDNYWIADDSTWLEEFNPWDIIESNISDWWNSVVGNDINNNPLITLEEGYGDLIVKWQNSQQIVSDLDVYMIENQYTIHHFTLMDRNLWATEVYNNNYSNTNINSLWSYYQWWNNYWFDSKAANPGILDNITWTTVDVSSYSWDNPYESSWFVKWTNWMQSLNSNLWWWNEDDVSHRQWPCPHWYHIPNAYEWRWVVNSYSNVVNGGTYLSRYLLMPAAWFRDRWFSVIGQVSNIWNYVYASSSLNWNKLTDRIVYALVSIGDGDLKVSNSSNNNPKHEWSSNGLSVRCLKNEVNTWIESIDENDIHINWWGKAIISLLSSWEVKLLQNPTRDSWTFWWRYTGADYSWEQIVVWSVLSTWSSLYAKWDCPEWEVDNWERCVKVYPYVITFDVNSWMVSQSNMSVVYGSTENLPIPIRTWYIFKWWYSNHDWSSNNYINYGDYYKFTYKISIHLSAYMENWNTYASWWNNNSKYKMISCTQQGGWSIESTQDWYIRFSNYDKGKGYKNAISEMMWSDLSSWWHDFDIVFDWEYTYWYLDWELIAQSERYVSWKIWYNSDNSIFLWAEADSNSTIPESGRYFIWRIKNVILENSDELITSWVAFNMFSMPNQDVTLYAEWEPEVYNIVYTWIDDAVFENENPLTYTAESWFTLNNPTRDHYNFIWWSWTDIDWISDIVTITTWSRGNRIYEAVWEPVKYTITWIDWDWNELKNEQVAYDTLPIYIGDIPTKTPTAKTWYTFNNIWIPTPYAVTWNETYRAQFSEYINKYVIKFYDGSGNFIESWEYEYWTVSWVYKPADPEKEWYTFIRWEPDLITVVTGATYNAVFSINQYELTLEKWVWVAELSWWWVYDYNTQYIYTWVALTWYHFEWWESVKEFTGLVPAHNVNIVVEAMPNTYYVRFNKNGWVWNMENQSFIYNQPQALNANKFTRAWYYFGWWSDRDGWIYGDKEVVLNLIPDGTIDFWVQWIKWVTPDPEPEPDPEPTPESWSPAAWWGRIIPKEEIQEHESAEIDTWTTVDTWSAVVTWTIENIMTGTQLMTWTTINTWINETSVPVIENTWTQEEIDAYEYAYKYWITTLAPRDTAMPDGNLQRWHMAKMVVNYAINVLWWTLPETMPKQCKWKDWPNAWESQEIKDYAQKACALWLMWIDMDYFQPYKLVTRAQFGTIIWRFLWWKLSSKPYYAEHLLRLKERWIMTQIDNPENRVEIRKWAWLMFMRMENYIWK